MKLLNHVKHCEAWREKGLPSERCSSQGQNLLLIQVFFLRPVLTEQLRSYKCHFFQLIDGLRSTCLLILLHHYGHQKEWMTVCNYRIWLTLDQDSLLFLEPHLIYGFDLLQLALIVQNQKLLPSY